VRRFLWARGTREKLCDRGPHRAWSSGPSTSPLGVVAKRVVAAFFLAPLAGALLYASTALLAHTLPGGFSEFLVTILLAYMFAASGTVAIALPVYLVLRRFGLVYWWSALGTGSVVGLLFALMIGSATSTLLTGNFALILIGAASGLAFWLLCGSLTPPNYRWRGP
jgi:hypothetical protein